MKNKAIGTYFAAISAVAALACLIVMIVYAGQGGKVAAFAFACSIIAILCEVSLCLGDKVWTEFVGVIGAAASAYSMMRVLQGGVWNIAEAVSGIRMSGIPELAGHNFLMVGLGLVTILFAILACFTRKEKVSRF